jgi:hypothetical protein
MAFVEYTAPAPKGLAYSKRSTKDSATLKVKRYTVTLGIGGEFLKKHKLDFRKGMRIWFDSGSHSIKIGVEKGSNLASKASESGYQSISITQVLAAFGLKAHKSAFNLPMKVEGRTLTISLRDLLQPKSQRKNAA